MYISVYCNFIFMKYYYSTSKCITQPNRIMCIIPIPHDGAE